MAWFMVFVFGWSLLATSIAGDMFPGSVKLKGCVDTLVDLREKANNTITCEGYNQNDTIIWSLERNGEKTTVATCNADSNCIVQPGYVDVHRSLSQSKLIYQQNDLEVDKTTKIECRSQLGTREAYKKCTFNVIRPATLPLCVVGVAAENGTAGGVCRFEGAFSSSRSFTCTWYLNYSQQISIPGNISYTSNSTGPNGWCTFLKKDMEMDHANSTYSILFYPGPGKMNVNSINVDLSTISGDIRKLLERNASSTAAALAFGCLGGVFLSVIVAVNAVIA